MPTAEPQQQLTENKMEVPTAAADVGIIGLATMGSNLVLNILDKGFCVATYNRTPETNQKFKVVLQPHAGDQPEVQGT